MKSKINLNKEQKEQAILKIKEYFEAERDEDLGDLGATLILDFITENLAPAFYNQGIKDAILFMNEKVDDLYGLEV